MAQLKLKDRVRILVGMYKDLEGIVDTVCNAEKGVAVRVFSKGDLKPLPITWFKPKEIEVI